MMSHFNESVVDPFYDHFFCLFYFDRDSLGILVEKLFVNTCLPPANCVQPLHGHTSNVCSFGPQSLFI